MRRQRGVLFNSFLLEHDSLPFLSLLNQLIRHVNEVLSGS